MLKKDMMKAKRKRKVKMKKKEVKRKKKLIYLNVIERNNLVIQVSMIPLHYWIKMFSYLANQILFFHIILKHIDLALMIIEMHFYKHH